MLEVGIHAELHHAPREHRLDTILLGQRAHGAGHGIHLVIMSAQRKTPHLVREVAHPGSLTAQAHQPVEMAEAKGLALSALLPVDRTPWKSRP